MQRYEGPVLAERDHIARQARKVEVSGALPSNDGYRSAFGDSPASLEEMVSHRLGEFGIDPASVVWDAWRRHDGTWTVTADFDPGTDRAASSIGEAAPARWTFHAGRKVLTNANRWAQQLSELEPIDGPVPERRLSAVADRPFDFETDTSELDEAEGPAGVEVVEDEAGDEFLQMLRSRRGQRMGLDEDADDELAAILGSHVPAAHPRPAEPASDDSTDDAGDTELDAAESGAGSTDSAAEAAAKPRMRGFPFLSLAPNPHVVEADSIALNEVSTETREVTLSGAPVAVPAVSAEPPAVRPADLLVPSSKDPEAAQPSDSEVAARLERKAAAKPKRSSVPSWDEIVFGTKGD